jgi:hypothetical protein
VRCDVCLERIVLNRDVWVYDERPFAPGCTLVTYAAHSTCHEAKQAANQAQTVNPRTTFFWRIR